MTSWTDEAGRTLIVVPADDDNPARLVVEQPTRFSEPPCTAFFWLDGSADLAGIAVAMFTANGQPAPVITPRPIIDASEPAEFRGFRLAAVDPGRQVRVSHDGSYEAMPPHAARQLAGLLVAYADAVESLPDPAAVDELALVLMEDGPTAMGLDGARPLARRILAAGWKREVPGNA